MSGMLFQYPGLFIMGGLGMHAYTLKHTHASTCTYKQHLQWYVYDSRHVCTVTYSTTMKALPQVARITPVPSRHN
jgi:hypothetical protein